MDSNDDLPDLETLIEIAYLKGKAIESGDWDKWERSQRELNHYAGVYLNPLTEARFRTWVDDLAKIIGLKAKKCLALVLRL
jgi:hypothetical protein